MRRVASHIRLRSVIPVGARNPTSVVRVLRAASAPTREYIPIGIDVASYQSLVSTYVHRLIESGTTHIDTVANTPEQIVTCGRLGFKQIIFTTREAKVISATEFLESFRLCLEAGVRIDTCIVDTWEQLLCELEIDPELVFKLLDRA